MTGKFVLRRSGDGFMFNLHASNGQVVLTSERYTAKSSAVEGIESVQQNAGDDGRYEPGENGRHFVLRASNGRVIGSSEVYASPEGAREGMEAVKRAARGAAVEDQT